MISRPGIIRARDPRWWRPDEVWVWRPFRCIDRFSVGDLAAACTETLREPSSAALTGDTHKHPSSAQVTNALRYFIEQSPGRSDARRLTRFDMLLRNADVAIQSLILLVTQREVLAAKICNPDPTIRSG